MTRESSRSGFVAKFVEEVQSRGRLVFSADDLVSRGKSGEGLEAGLRRYAATGAIRRISGGAFVIVPPEHRSMGAPPVEWWLDDFMAHHGLEYYLGLLSAAEAHGSAHFAVMETHVVTSKWLRPIELGRLKIRFFQKRGVGVTPMDAWQNQWATVKVSSPEATVLDLLHLRPCGVARIAMILSDLAKSFKKTRLRDALDVTDTTAAAQRLGFLLQNTGNEAMASVVEQWLASRKPQPISFEAGGQAHWATSRSWKIKINASLEAAS
jgi:predicted transcriptional regulator of viral defense system